MRNRRVLVPYILEYLESHKYVKAKDIALFYLEKKGIKNYNDVKHNKLIKELIRRISGYFSTLTTENYKEKSKGVFIRTDEIIRGLNDLLEGKRMMDHCYGKFESRTDMNLNIEWRKFEDLTKNETIWFNDQPHVKMYFLGIIEKVDLHFKELYKNGSKDYDIKKKRRKKIRMNEEEMLARHTINYLLKNRLFSFRILANNYIDKLIDFNPDLLRSRYSKVLTKTFKKQITNLNLKLLKIDKYYVSNIKIIDSLKGKIK